MKDRTAIFIIFFVFILIISLVIYKTLTPKPEGFLFKNNENYLIPYKINDIIPIYISDEEMANKYLSEYVNFIMFKPKKAYELLSDTEKNSKFTSYEIFENYIEKIKSLKFKSAKVIRYSYITYDNKKVLYVVDNAGNNFKFIENSIMNYKVEIN